MNLTKQTTAEEVNEFIFQQLTAWREKNPEFTFLTRTNDKVGSRRLANGWWFHGNQNYVFTSLFKLSGHNHMSRSIGFCVLNLDRKTIEPSIETLVVWPGEPDAAKVHFYKRMVTEIPGFEEGQPDRYSKKYDADWTVEQALAFFLEHDYPKMLAILEEEGFAKEALVTSEEMEQFLAGVKHYREDTGYLKNSHHQNLRKVVAELDDNDACEAFFEAGGEVLKALGVDASSSKLYAAIRSEKALMHITVGGCCIIALERKGNQNQFGFYCESRLHDLEKKYGKKLAFDESKRGVWYSGSATVLNPKDFYPGMIALAQKEAKAVASQFRSMYAHLHNQWILDASVDPEIRAEFIQPEEGNVRRIWRIAAGENRQFWPEWIRENVVGMDWDIGDLKACASKELIGEKLKERYGYETVPVNSRLAMYQFAHEVKRGDLVVAKDGTNTYLGIGRVAGDYQYRSNQPLSNIRSVEWLSQKVHENVNYTFSRKTLTEIPDNSEEFDLLKSLYGDALGSTDSETTLDGYGKTEILDEVFLEERQLDAIMRGLKLKKNIILQGPPGTGKTFIATRLAYLQLGKKDASRREMVQFHQSYSYEDFIQGFRPNPQGGFFRKDGVFMRFCQRAEKDLGSPYFFIIDEINRGNLSKIFGELMMLIEADKRGPEHAVSLTYSDGDERFSIPENVHIIGTMNTADRSLAMVDYALRRRFAFFDLPPQFNEKFKSFLLNHGITEPTVNQVMGKLSNLNQTIRSDKNLGAGFEIGHSYFCSVEGVTADQEDEWFNHIIDREVGPQLLEFWFDDKAQAEAEIAKLKSRD